MNMSIVYSSWIGDRHDIKYIYIVVIADNTLLLVSINYLIWSILSNFAVE